MSNFLLLNFSMGPDGGDVVDHRGKKKLFVEDVLNYSLFALHGRSGSFSPLSSSSWSQLAAAVVVVVMAKNSAAAF